MADRYSLGARGEAAAARYLEGLGFRVVERNYRCKIGEIDLICTRGKLLVFVEVKARRSCAYGAPQEAVDGRKARQIRRVAAWYLTQGARIKRFYDDFDIRFDVVEVRAEHEAGWDGDGDGADGDAEVAFAVNHIERAF